MIRFGLLLALLMSSSALANAQCELQMLTADVPTQDDLFGESVGVDGGVIVVGAPEDVGGTGGPGEAYVFRFDGSSWVEEQKLTSSDGIPGDEFGLRVAVSGDVFVATAFDADGQQADSGAAYVFRYDGSQWDEEQKLTASDGMTGDGFVHCDVDGDVIVVGATNSLAFQGSAYVFRYNGTSWVEEQKLTASDGDGGDFFGRPSVSGDTIVALGSSADGAAPNSGAAYVFRYDGSMWCEEQKLIAGDTTQSGFSAVAAHGDVIAVGASNPAPGAVYVYRYNGTSWFQEQKLTPAMDAQFGLFVATDGTTIAVGANDSFFTYNYDGSVWTNEQNFPTPPDGFPPTTRVALHGDTVVAGQPGTTAAGTETGSVLVYSLSTPSSSELVAGDGDGDNVGRSTGVDGHTALIGAPSDDGVANNNGSAYVFRYDGASWSQEQKLLPSSADANENFGESCDLFGDVAVIGAHCPGGSCATTNGAAYIFRYDGTTWSEEERLTASDGASDDRFGDAAAIYGNIAVVGAPRHANRGAVYVYRYDGQMWDEEQKIVGDIVNDGDQFGSEVDVCGDVIIVGAPQDDDADGTEFCESGAAYIFRYNGSTWVEEQKIVGDGCKQFRGLRVAIDGDVAAIGTDGTFVHVYRYDGSTWVEEQQLTATSGSLDSAQLSVEGDIIVAGNSSDGDAGSSAGAIHVYRYDGTTWNEGTKLTASDASSGDALGGSIALSGSTVIAGATQADGTVANSGTAYIFALNEALCLTPFIRGDSNGDGDVNIADAISILMVLFDGAGTDCLDALDVNDNDAISVSDAFHLVCFLFCSPSGSPPPTPYPACGTDPTDGVLECDSLASCP